MIERFGNPCIPCNPWLKTPDLLSDGTSEFGHEKHKKAQKISPLREPRLDLLPRVTPYTRARVEQLGYDHESTPADHHSHPPVRWRRLLPRWTRLRWRRLGARALDLSRRLLLRRIQVEVRKALSGKR